MPKVQTSVSFVNPLSDEEYKSRLYSRREDIRGPYFRDQTAIIHSLPFRRLKNKAQVFFAPNNDHICTRIEHAFHVATIAETIAKALNLKEEMAYTIGLGHDLGHAPFGHAGEKALKNKCSDIGGFIHEIHGLRIVDKIGDRGKSLNLTYGVRDGIICHCGEAPEQVLQPRKKKKQLEDIRGRNIYPCSYEGCIVRIADRIAYIGRDIEDALLGGFIKRSEIPKCIDRITRARIRNINADFIDFFVGDVISYCNESGKIGFSNEKYSILMELYNFSIKKIYEHEKIINYGIYCEKIIVKLFDYLCDIHQKWGSKYDEYSRSSNPLDRRFGRYLKYMKKIYSQEKAGTKKIVRDYVAGMTDRYALRCMKEISFPEELCFDIFDIKS